MALSKQKSKKPALARQKTQHTHQSDDELFRMPVERLKGDILLQLSRRHSPREIFDQVNSIQPGSVKSVEIIRGRIKYATNAAAVASGRTIADIREEIAEARQSYRDQQGEEDEDSLRRSHANNTLHIASKPKVRFPQDQAPKLGTHMLCVFVGPQFKINTLHTGLLPPRTRTILEERAQQNLFPGVPVYLIQDFPEDFEVYRNFLYSDGKIFTSNAQADQDHVDDGEEEEHDDREWLRLARAYNVGLDLDDEKFRNAVLDAFIEKVVETEDRYPTSIAAEVYSQTAPSDKLRSLIVDLHVWKGQGTGVRPPHDDASGPAEFMQDVLHGLADAGSDAYDPEVPMPWEKDSCKYHVHTLTEPCAQATTSSAVTHAASVSQEQQLLSASSEARYKCVECDQPFSTSRGLNSHRQSAEHKKKLRACAAQASQ